MSHTAGTNSRRSRQTAQINFLLDKRLMAYAAAAGAAGVSLLAAPAAQAKVVYTPANTVIGSSTLLDLNHDGIADFALGFHELDKSIILAVGPKVTGNAIRLGNAGGAAAGFFGVPVGPGEKFAATTGGYSWGLMMADAGSYSVTWFFGPWANATNRYLGLKFVINGQIHYGWARLTVPDYIHGQQVVLTGYAYETIPNKPIISGKTSGSLAAHAGGPTEVLPLSHLPASLCLLARGADGLAIWRRDEEAAFM
jgi:hypothetical protein